MEPNSKNVWEWLLALRKSRDRCRECRSHTYIFKFCSIWAINVFLRRSFDSEHRLPRDSEVLAIFFLITGNSVLTQQYGSSCEMSISETLFLFLRLNNLTSYIVGRSVVGLKIQSTTSICIRGVEIDTNDCLLCKRKPHGLINNIPLKTSN